MIFIYLYLKKRASNMRFCFCNCCDSIKVIVIQWRWKVSLFRHVHTGWLTHISCCERAAWNACKRPDKHPAVVESKHSVESLRICHVSYSLWLWD